MSAIREDEIDLALEEPSGIAANRFRDLGWDAIGPICKRLGTDESLDYQISVISLMYDITHVAHQYTPAPTDLPVDQVCRCLQMHADPYEDLDLERTRRRLLMRGGLLLGHMNDPAAIDTLLMFINTGENKDLDGGYNRVDEFCLKAISELVESSSSFCEGEDGYPPRSKTNLMEGQAEQIEREMIAYLEVSNDRHDRITALEILVMLEQPHIVEYMEGVMQSDNYRERSVALSAFRENWDPRLMPLVLSQLGLQDSSDFGQMNPNWYLRDVVSIIGIRGGAEHVQLLIDLLGEHSRMTERGDMNVRNTIRRALVRLREHSRGAVEQALERGTISPGFRRSLDKVLTLMDEAEEGIDAPDQMRYDLFSWRTEKFEEEGLDYPFQILTDRQVFEIASRAPQTYEGLMGIDGVGPYKTNKYGPEILSIIRRHMNPDDSDAANVRPWSLPIDVRRWLFIELETVDRGVWDALVDEEKPDYLRRINAHTKMRIKREARNDHLLRDNNHEILDKVIDSVIRSLTYEDMLPVAGQRRGVRYARFLQCSECSATDVEFGDGHLCECHICRQDFTGTQCFNVQCLLNVTQTMIFPD